MEYIIPKKLIGWNINIASVYLEFLNVLSWKTWKTIEKISNILLGIRYSKNINSIKSGIILPKQLQVQFLKFYPKDWFFLKISTKLQIEGLQFHDLMLLRKFDACFETPNLCRFLSEYFIPGRLSWAKKTCFLISPGSLQVLFNK